MMAGCRVLKEEPNRTYVHVIGDKRPKWVNHDDPKWKLTDNTDQALAWLGIEE